MYSCKELKLEEVNKEQLTDLSLSVPYSLLYTSLSYLSMLSSFLRAEVVILTVDKEEDIVGFMPLVFRHDSTYGAVCNSLPFYGSNGGMIVSNKEDKNAIRKLLLEQFKASTQKRNCISTTVISNPLDAEGDEWLKANVPHNLLDERIGQITHLVSDNESAAKTLMDSFEDPRPRNIRKAQKENVTVHADNSKEAMDFLYQTHYDNITAINGIAKEKRFFDDIPQFFTDKEYKIYIAEKDGQKIGALLLFYFNETVEYFTPAVVESYRGLQPTALIIYQAMLDAIKEGYKNWNWGGTWLSQGGVYDFKKKWGTTDYRYYYYTNVTDEKVFHMQKEDLLRNYQYFFVLPFSALKNEKN